MNQVQTSTETITLPVRTDIQKTIRGLTKVMSNIQSFLDHPEGVEKESIYFIASTLEQAQKTLLEVEARLQQSETNLTEAQQIIQSVTDLQILLDILPVGIIVAHDPQSQNMTINRAGLMMLNLPADMNLTGIRWDQQPFKVLRAGKEIPAGERPMQYAMKHRVDLRDIELDIQHPNGRVINLLEYASPLYDPDGSVHGSVGVMVDITAHKSIEQRLVMQYRIARVLAESNSINEAAAQVLQMICETSGWEYGALWQVESDNITLTNEGVWFAANHVNLSQHAESIHYSVLNGNNRSLPGTVYQSGQPLWLSNLEGINSQDAVDAKKAGLNSAFILPVRSKDRVIAILECLSTHNQIQDENLTTMLNAVCNQIGIFLERKLLEEKLAVRANQQHLLAEIGMALSTSLDYEQRLQTIVHMIVPDLADWCAIDVIDNHNILRRVAVAHVDQSKEELLYQIQPTRQVDYTQANTPQVETLLNGQTLLFTDIPFSLIEKTTVDAGQLENLRKLDPVSSIIVPLIAHHQILGICTFVQSDSKRHYFPSDLPLAEDIVRQAALALDNAFLYSESQKHNIELEDRVNDRTAQLKDAITQLVNQITERQNAENQVRVLNAELEQRIAERTSQLEVTNRNLTKEVLDHQQTSQMLRILLDQTRELYRISQSIGTVRTPDEILSVLLSSSYLENVSRASIAILDKPWKKGAPPPDHVSILAEWNGAPRQPKFINRQFTLEEYGIVLPVTDDQPIVIRDVQLEMKLPEAVRKRFADLHTHGLIILPLIAGGEWYGLLSFHFKTHRTTKIDDLHHISGLVSETAIAIKNMRLLETESQARHEAEAANDLKLKFLAMISHELRTPLASIKGFATTLLAEDIIWSAEKQRDFLQIIDFESDKLGDLIEQLLDLSRMEAGVMRISPKKVFLNNILDSALAQLQALTTEHDLILDIPPDLPPIFGDEQRIAQVLTNLVGNSAKFSPAQTPIIISARPSGDMVQIDVVDHGPGIPAKNRSHIFESFRQLKNGRDNPTKGAGLGLAICKGLIEAHKGKIWVQNRHKPGTVISFTLPTR